MTTNHDISAQIADRLQSTRDRIAGQRDALALIEAEEQSLAKALRALDPDNPMVAKAAVEKPKRRSASQVKPEVKAKVLGTLKGEMTAPEIAAVCGLSRDYVARSLAELRVDGDVHLKGVRKAPGAPKIFARVNGSA